MKLRYGVGAIAVVAAAVLAACGGGSGGGFTPHPGPSQSSAPTPPPVTSTSAPLSSSTTPVSLPAISNGSSATVTLPAASGSATATVTLQDTLPTGATTPQVRHAQAIGGGTVTPLDYVVVSVSQTISVASTPAFSFTLASPPASGTNTYIAVLDVNNAKAGWNVLLGPGSISGNTISFAAQALAPPLTLQTGDTYVFALVATTSVVTPPPPTIAPNTAATYTGTKTVNYAFNMDFDYPTPGPSATAPPAQTLSYSVNASVSIGTAQFPGTTTAQLIDEHIAETDAGSLANTSYTTDSWVSLAPATSGYNEQLYGQTVQEPSSANLPVITTLYNTPQTVDQLPETSGASWTNSPQSTVMYSYASGDSGTRTVAADGSYTDNEQMGPSSSGGAVALTENPDGSGSIAGPYFGGGIIDSVDFSAPLPAPSPGATPALNVTINYDPFVQQNYGYPPSAVVSDDVWYPYTSGQAPMLYSETDLVTTGVKVRDLPAGCTAVPYASVNDVQRTITSLDTVIGDIDKTTVHTYDVGGFPVCLSTHDVLGFAYDQQGNTPSFLLIGDTADLEVITTDETLAIQNTPSTSSTTPSVRTQAVASARAFAAALQGHVLNALARDRVTHIHTFLKALKDGRPVQKAFVHGGRR